MLRSLRGHFSERVKRTKEVAIFSKILSRQLYKAPMRRTSPYLFRTYVNEPSGIVPDFRVRGRCMKVSKIRGKTITDSRTRPGE